MAMTVTQIASYRNKIVSLRRNFPKSAAKLTAEFAEQVEAAGADEKLWIAKTAFGIDATTETLDEFLGA